MGEVAAGGSAPGLNVQRSEEKRGRKLSLRLVNPAIRLLGSIFITVALVLQVDPYVPALVSLGVLTMLLLAGARIGRRIVFFGIIALSVGVTSWLYAAPKGQIFWSWGPITISEASTHLGLSLGLRVFAFGLAALLVVADVDLTEMSDGLVQILHLPRRVVFASLAAFGLIGSMIQDLRQIGYARRVRGGAGRWQRRSLERCFGIMLSGFVFLVLAIRRGSRLAAAMQSRGFGRTSGYTRARRSRVGAADVVYLAACLALVLVAYGLAPGAAAAVTGFLGL